MSPSLRCVTALSLALAAAGAAGAQVVTTRGYDPRAYGYLHTEPALAPAVSVPAFSSASPYSLSTYSAYYGGYPYYPIQDPTSASLQGLASLTAATGQYYKDVQTARIYREQSRQASLETTRQRLQLQMEYEANRPTAPKLAAIERQAALEWARKYASRTEIAAGGTLNVLLRNVLEARDPAAGPNVPLEADTVKGLNLTDKASRGNLALAKDDGKIAWTEALEEPAFDKVRDSFGKNFARAVDYANAGKEQDRRLLRELRDDLKALDGLLDEQVRELPPSRYIESRRLINQLKDTVNALSNPNFCKACQAEWRKGVRTVKDLVTYCRKNGLEFAPAAAPGDYPAYLAAYYALRSYEGELGR